jgi:hypothetical protein
VTSHPADSSRLRTEVSSLRRPVVEVPWKVNSAKSKI